MLSVQGVGKCFQERWIFRNVDLHIRDGESVALIGPSGGGKSVLLKTIAGLLTPDEGRIEIGTENVGMLFQKNALFDSMTVEENLLFPLKERLGIVGEEARRRAADFLDRVNLSGNESLYPDEISGGMQKRLGIARALIVEPKLILYDEPTAGLDPVTSRVIAEMIQHLRERVGSTLLTVTNDVQRAYQLGDRICMLALGELKDGGTAAEVKRSRDPVIRQFVHGLKQGPLSPDARLPAENDGAEA
ncbi:MAG: ABC transporter ATP-binding protein [Bacteriovoracia bacterium]